MSKALLMIALIRLQQQLIQQFKINLNSKIYTKALNSSKSRELSKYERYSHLDHKYQVNLENTNNKT